MIEVFERRNRSNYHRAVFDPQASCPAADAVLASPTSLRQALAGRAQYYLEDDQVRRVWLALRLGKPMLVEGPAGCGKTELARSLATVLSAELIRVTCGDHTPLSDLFFREGSAPDDAWGRAACPASGWIGTRRRSEPLIPGALLRAIRLERKGIVLLDELDKAPVAFDHALLEWLEDFTLSDPLRGTFQPITKPYVVLTSNTTRPLSEQLRDRCVFLYFEALAPEREAEILRTKSGADSVLSAQVAFLCRAFRELGFKAPPSLREALDLIQACKILGAERLTFESLKMLLNLAVKRRDDAVRAEKNLPVLWARMGELAAEPAAERAHSCSSRTPSPSGGLNHAKRL